MAGPPFQRYFYSHRVVAWLKIAFRVGKEQRKLGEPVAQAQVEPFVRVREQRRSYLLVAARVVLAYVFALQRVERYGEAAAGTY